jgi:hypothetical protein
MIALDRRKLLMNVEYSAVSNNIPPLAQLSVYLPWWDDTPEETLSYMGEKKATMVRALKRGRTAADRKLGEKLAACLDCWSAWDWCHQPMCPLCVERLRKSFILEGAACVAALMQQRKLPISWLQADLPGQRFQLGDLRKIDVPSIYRCVERQYLHAGFRLVFSGIDLIVDGRTKAKPFWQARINSVVVGPRTKDLIRSMSDFYPQSTWCELSRQDLGEALFSTIEPVFYQEAAHGPSEDLQPPQIRELAHCLARYDMSVRYNLIGCYRDKGWIKPYRDVPKQ